MIDYYNEVNGIMPNLIIIDESTEIPKKVWEELLMGKKEETRLKSRVKASIKKKYPDAFIYAISDRWISGMPDLFIIIQGVQFFLELKIPGEKPRKLQKATICKINKAGGYAYARTTVKDCMDLIEILLDSKKNPTKYAGGIIE